MKTLEGKLVSDGMKVGIVAARFNEFITSKLVSGAMDGLTRHNVKEEDIPALAVAAFNDVCTGGNPRPTSVAEIEVLYRKAF